MTPFDYAKATSEQDAVARTRNGTAKYLGAGTNLVDLMREGVEGPDQLVDVTSLSKTIEPTDDGGLLIGAAVSNTAVAEHTAVRAQYPALSRAILSGASQ